MRYRQFAIHLSVAWLLLAGWSVLLAQELPGAQSSTPSETLSDSVTPETVAERKSTVEEKLKALAESKRPEEELKSERAPLDKILKVLTALEEAWRKRDNYADQLEALPQRFNELDEEEKRLKNLPPGRFPQVTEKLREDYNERLKAAQEEIQKLSKQMTSEQVRLGAIAGELEKRAVEIPELEKELLRAPTKAEDEKAGLDVELRKWRLQLLRAEVEALKGEQKWLNKSTPLYDAGLRVAKLRLEHIQRDLETIQEALGISIEQEQRILSVKAADIERKLRRTTDPAEALLLRARLDTINLHKTSAEYSEEQNRLGGDIQARQKRIADLQQGLNRFMSMMEKYEGGENVTHRLLMTIQRLKRLRLRYRDTPERAVETRLSELTSQLFTVEDWLFDFDSQAQKHIEDFEAALQTMPAPQREASMANFNKALDEQRAALREQQQTLSALVQDHTALLALYRQYRTLIDDAYAFALKRIFWIRDAKTLSWDVVSDAIGGAKLTIGRLGTLGRAALTGSRSRPAPVILILMLVVILPWAALLIRRRLNRVFTASFAVSDQKDSPPPRESAIYLIAQASVWPAYVALAAWLLRFVLLGDPQHSSLGLALIHGLWIAALVLAISLFLRALLQPDGWTQRFWRWSAELCRFLRQLAMLGSVAALALLVPHFVLLAALGNGEATGSIMALARLFFLGFQAVLLVLVALAGRPGSPLMNALLARSRQADGLLWRIWPFFYALLLAALIGNMALNFLGYRYAARSIWLRASESLLLLVFFRVVVAVLVVRLLRSLTVFIFQDKAKLKGRYPGLMETLERPFRVVYGIGKVCLWLLAVVVVLEIWDVSIFHFLASRRGSEVLIKALFIALTLGVTVTIIRLNKTLTEYLSQTKTTSGLKSRDYRRKVKTLAPLFETVVDVVVVFVAALVVLEILGISTGPFLAGLGIFGLAVGFASQSLIKDIINGLFILFEDSVDVGDVAELNGKSGVVEKITLRTVTIRALDGTVHVIPNSTIEAVSNMTKGFSRYVLDIRVPLHGDVDKVMDILRQIDEEMRQDAAFGRDMLFPLEVLGVERFEESWLIIRARLNTRPMEQWRIGREFNRRMKQVFDEHGIEIPVPHRVLYWGGHQQDWEHDAARQLKGIQQRETRKD